MGPDQVTKAAPRSGFRDFLQSASNAVAGNVSGPVDLIAAGLRAAGVPIGAAPVGGSAWMEQRGLTRAVPQSAASLAGETAGLVGPMAAAAKAPQVAAGLLRMGENAGAPRTLNPQLGAIVWHGSPHKFDRFDSSKIGTGEGAQAYGHGLYLAESPGVAKQYAGDLAAARASRPIGNVDLATAYQNMPSDVPQSLLAARRDFRALNDMGELSLSDRRDFLEAVRNNIVGAQSGNLYKVDLPDEKIARMLDWDKPLSQQAEGVREALRKGGISGKEWQVQALGDGPQGYLNDRWVYNSATDARMAINELRGQGYYARTWKPDGETVGVQDLVKGAMQDKYADRLRELGIPGIRYLDGSSRGTGAGTSNFVLFPGEENALRILERNGVPLR